MRLPGGTGEVTEGTLPMRMAVCTLPPAVHWRGDGEWMGALRGRLRKYLAMPCLNEDSPGGGSPGVPLACPVAVWGRYPRLTLDADILVDDAPDNLRRLLDCLAGWGERWARQLRPEDFAPQEGSVRVMEEFDLDIFTRMGGHTLADVRPRLRHLDPGGVRIPYLSPADLILLKRDSWREKDKLDVLAMREIIAREGSP